MEKTGVSVNLLLQADAPKRCGAPFVAASQSADVIIVEADAHDFRPHVVEQIVGLGVDGQSAEPRQVSAVEQRAARFLGV